MPNDWYAPTLRKERGESSEWAAIHYMWCGNGFKFHALPMSMSYQPTDRAYHSQWYWLFSFSWNELAHYSLAYRLCDHRRAHCSPNWIYCFHLPGTLCGVRVCVCLCVRVLIELWVCHAYLICSCVISYNIRLLQCRDNGRIDLISGERADGHRDLLIASLIPGEYAFLKSVWVFFSGFRFVLNRWTKKATTSKSK